MPELQNPLRAIADELFRRHNLSPPPPPQAFPRDIHRPEPPSPLRAILQDLIRIHNLGPPPPYQPSLRDIYREQVMTAYAKATILVSEDTPRTHRPMCRFLPEDVWCPTRCQFRRLGGLRALYERVERGNLGIEAELGVWGPDFFHGLRLAGALCRERPRTGAVWERLHRDLVADLAEMPLPHRLEPKSRPGKMRRFRCPASLLPALDPVGSSVVAGLFAGGLLKEWAGEMWIELPGEEEVRTILDRWSIYYRAAPSFRGRSRIHVSPFYAALFAHLMPPHSATRVLNLRHSGMCPLLPAVYWELGFHRKGMHILPFARALPFGCSRRSWYRRGFRRKELHWQRVLELRIVQFDRRLRELMVRWYEQHSRERSTSRNCSNLQPAPTALMPQEDHPPTQNEQR